MFRDWAKDSEGRIQSLIIFNEKNEAFFESLTVNLTKPVERTVRLHSSDIVDAKDAHDPYKFSRPRRKLYEEQQPLGSENEKWR